MKSKLELACYLLPNKDIKNKTYCYGWSKVDNICDIWNFIGWLVNTMDEAITFNYLQYYNEINNNFEKWIAEVKNNIYNENVVAEFSCGKFKYQIELEER